MFLGEAPKHIFFFWAPPCLPLLVGGDGWFGSAAFFLSVFSRVLFIGIVCTGRTLAHL